MLTLVLVPQLVCQVIIPIFITLLSVINNAIICFGVWSGGTGVEVQFPITYTTRAYVFLSKICTNITSGIYEYSPQCLLGTGPVYLSSFIAYNLWTTTANTLTISQGRFIAIGY